MSSTQSKRVLLVGGSGFVGNELGISLVAAGYQINLITRNAKKCQSLGFPAQIFEYEKDGAIPESATQGVQAIVNLAGESIADGRWTQEKKDRILRSRIESAKIVTQAAETFNIETVIQASAVGYYGDTKQAKVTEASPSGEGFLADVVKAWETPASSDSTKFRKVTMRLGVVFGASGGALLEMLTPYVMGVGASIGNGSHYMSWVHIKDLCKFVLAALSDETMEGPYNLTSPEPVTYKDLHKSLVRRFGGFSWMQIPSALFKVAFGEKSQIFLMSQRVLPRRLLECGFEFDFSNLEDALKDILGTDHQKCAVMSTKQWVPAGRPAVWDYFSTAKNLEELTPPWLNFRVEGLSTNEVQDGSKIDYRLKIHGLPVNWKSEIVNFQAQESFQDIQLKGPYKTWHHTHRFSDLGAGTLVEDFVKFRLPLGSLGNFVAYHFVMKDVRKIFSFRRQKITNIFAKG
jgi:hypothetical protein